MARIAALLLLASAATAAVVPRSDAVDAAVSNVELERRVGTTYCGQWDSETDGQYTVYNNGWGWGSATSGSNCMTVTSYTSSSKTIAWKTTWSFTGGTYDVKSYPNARITINKKVSAITSIPTTWKWSYSGSSIVGDVAWDGWLATSTSAAASYELMIFVGSYGGWGPFGSQVGTLSYSGVTWKIFKGTITTSSASWTVISYQASSTVTSVSLDIKTFLNDMVNNRGVSSSLYFTTLGAGTEPVTGSGCTFTTSAYTISVS